jgi:hypothetical protein
VFCVTGTVLTFEDSFEAAASDLLLELEVAAGGRGVDGLGLLLLVLLLLLLQLLFLLLEESVL